SNLSIRAGKDYTSTPNLMPALAMNDRPSKTTLEPRNPNANTAVGGLTTKPATAALHPGETPWYGRWYVWAGAGAVVAAAAGGTVAVVANNGPRLTPDQVCNGPCDATIN